jgi:DNA helicase-2/ATP-dependent DNA helicase PcrA
MPYSYGNFKASPNQNEAINHSPSPLMIIAGAGTGKTSTLLHRIRHLILSDAIDSKNTLLLTFTEKATVEAQNTLKSIMGDRADSIFVGTFHSFCHSIMRRFGPEDRLNDVLWDKNDALYYLINHFDDMDFIRSRVFSENPMRTIQDSFIPFFGRVSDELLSLNKLEKKINNFDDSQDWIDNNFPGIHPDNTKFDDIPFQLRDLVNAYSFYKKGKVDQQALDFGDMIVGCYELLNNNESILKKVRKEFKHIFIDEYQDNNYALNKIVNLIMTENPSITVVGDEDQCIYSFRGANYYNISDFRNRYKSHSEYAEITLSENRRSTQQILDIANDSISNNPNRTPKILRCPEDDIKTGIKPLWIQATKQETFEKLPTLIHSLINNGDALYGDIAVICRGWGNVTAVSDAMQKAAIPVDVHIEKFFDVPIVKNVLSWGHLVIKDHKADIALYRILQQQCGEEWTTKFFKSLERSSIDDKLIHLEKLQADSTDIGFVLKSLSTLQKAHNKTLKADEMVWQILKVLKSSPFIKDLRSEYRYTHRLNLANAGKILDLAEKFVNKDPRGELNKWLRFMDIMALDKNQSAAQPDIDNKNLAVQVMSIHQSKGLQFPIVIIPFLYSGSFPSRLIKPKVIDRLPTSWTAWGQNTDFDFRELHIQEERRVFYVGITRAENQLYLFGPTKTQSLFTKELEKMNPQPMEIKEMDSNSEKQFSLNERQQQLLADLNREIAANQIDNARDILSEMENNTSMINLVTSDKKSASGSTLNLSSSKINTYNSCSYKYRLKYIDKVPEQKTRASSEFGLIIHAILEEYHSLPKEKQSKDELLSLLEKYWREDSFEYRLRADEFKKQGKEVLSDYFQFISENPLNVVGVEKHFSYVMKDLNVNISGKIDRIDKVGDSLNIIDYKTSRKKEKAKNNIQLALYIQAINNGALSDIPGSAGNAILHYLRFGDDPISSHQFSDSELEEYSEKIRKVAEGIRSKTFETKKSDFNCKNCDYKEFLCPAWEE